METRILTQAVNKLMMLSINVSDMQKSKDFYTNLFDLKITTDYRMDDDNWWVSLAFPEGGATLALARAKAYPENIRPETMSLYFETSDVFQAHKKLSRESVGVSEVQDDLFGPGSGVKFFNLKDPDGNLVHLVQAHEAGVPF